MKPARKHRPNWDDASYLMRTDPEREEKPRLEGGKLPRFKKQPFDIQAALKSWRAIGVHLSAEQIREHMAMLKKWEKGE
jgi:hypothetical protein